MGSLSRTLIKSSFVRTVNVFLQIIVAFIMTPIIVHSLGDRMYGFWVFVGTFLGYYGLLDLGLSSAVTRYISRAVGEGDTDEINKVVNTSLVIFSVIGVAVLVLTSCAVAASSLFINNPEELDLFRKIVAMLGVSMAIGFPVRVFGGVLDANMRYDLSTYAAIIRLIVANIAIYTLLKSGYGILGLATVSFLVGFLEYCLIIGFAKRHFGYLIVSRLFFDRALISKLFNYSGKTFVAQVADILRFRVDNVVIAGFLNVSLVTYYSIGAKFIEYFGQIMASATGIMTPVFSQYEGKGDYDAIRQRFLEVTQVCVVLSVFIGTSIMFYGKWFIERWMGKGYESSYYVLLILCISSIIALMQSPGIGLLYGISKHHYYAIANTCEGILNLVLSLILVRYYGIYGVALGTTAEMLIFKLFIQPVFICNSIGLSLRLYFIEVIVSNSIKTLIPLGFYYWIAKIFIKPEYDNILFFGIIQLIAFSFFVFYFILNLDMRIKLKSAVFNKYS